MYLILIGEEDSFIIVIKVKTQNDYFWHVLSIGI